jgi:GT2 family glycosyltransferase
VNGLSVVIPSKTLANLLPCVEAVRKHEPVARIIVVDDGVDWNELECVGLVGDELIRRGITLFRGASPFIFARNCNIGIEAAGKDDVVLLNDDALLETPGGFTRMQSVAKMFHDISLVSASTNIAGNPEQQKRHGQERARILVRPTPGNSFPTVAFVCVLIPRRTINAVGLLDEIFTGYGFEDNDYCRRIDIMKQQIAVHDGCYVDHGKLTSTYRGAPTTGGKLEEGRRIYMEKWGRM